MPTTENRFLFELDGVTAFVASEVNGVGKDHTEFELYVGNRANPIIGRGNYKCTDVVIKQAHALNEAGFEFMRWMDDYLSGRGGEKRGARLIILDEDGVTPVATYELLECVPKKYEAGNGTASSNNAAMFTATIRPTDLILF